MLDLLYNGCMHDVGFQTNLTVSIRRGIADVSAFDAGFFCVGIPMTKVIIHKSRREVSLVEQDTI